MREVVPRIRQEGRRSEEREGRGGKDEGVFVIQNAVLRRAQRKQDAGQAEGETRVCRWLGSGDGSAGSRRSCVLPLVIVTRAFRPARELTSSQLVRLR